MILIRRINSGNKYPRGYGLYYVDHYLDQAVCLPIPLNLIARAARELYFWLVVGWRRGKFPTCASCRFLRPGNDLYRSTYCGELSIGGTESAIVDRDGALAILDPEKFGCSEWRKR